jgi:hypothetical protein
MDWRCLKSLSAAACPTVSLIKTHDPYYQNRTKLSSWRDDL